MLFITRNERNGSVSTKAFSASWRREFSHGALILLRHALLIQTRTRIARIYNGGQHAWLRQRYGNSDVCIAKYTGACSLSPSLSLSLSRRGYSRGWGNNPERVPDGCIIEFMLAADLYRGEWHRS